jgi:DNA-binding transcriptional LysR family regulator
MDLRQLEAFVAVATLGSFKAAANRLSLTQPAISARIAALESDVGEELFRRDIRPIGLSDKAKRMLPYAEQMLELSQQIRPSKFGETPVAAERLRIGTNSSLVNGLLPHLSRRLRQAMPHVTIEYDVGASHRLKDRMLSGELDVCLMHAPSNVPGIRREHVCDMHGVWAARAGLVPEGRLSIQELLKYDIVTLGPEASSFLLFEAALRKKGLWPIAHLSTNYADVIISHIKNRDFVGMILKDCIINELQSGELVELQIDCDLETYQLHVCCSVTKSKIVAKRCFEEILSFARSEMNEIRGWA